MDNTTKTTTLRTGDGNSNISSQGVADICEEYDIINAPEAPIDNNHSLVNVHQRQNASSNIAPTPQQKEAGIMNKAGPGMVSDSDVQKTSAVEAQPSEQQSIVCPRINCPEKIVICLDLNEEMDTTVFRSRAGDKYTGLELAQRTVKMFVTHKTQMNPKHEFAFLIFHEEPTMIHTFTPRAQDILNTIDDSVIETRKSGPLNLTHLFETIKENIELPVVDGDPQVIPPPYVVRVLMVFGRSHSIPVVSNTEAQRRLESSPYFFTDVLYIHEPPSEGNQCEEIFPVLCELDHSGMSYIFEESKYTPILNSGAKLLAHPLQRPRQLDAVYKIGAPVPSAAPVPPPAASAT